MVRVLRDADAAFLMTDFWASKSRDVEVKQGKNAADAAKQARVKHVIFSSLENVTKNSNGRLKHVVHFDGKNEVEQYIRFQDFETVSFIQPGFYMSNFPGRSFRKGDDDVHNFIMPVSEKAQIPLFDVEADFGKEARPGTLLC